MSEGRCRISGEPLVSCIDFGEQYVSDFVVPGQECSGDRASLRVGIGLSSGIAQLYDSYPPEKLYRRYWYRSGINDSMRRELKDIVDSAMCFSELRRGDTVLDIASNDGTLLSFYPETCTRIGIDPSNVAAESQLYGGKIVLVNDFFSAKGYRLITDAKAKIVTVIAMFYDLEDPDGFLRQVREIIDERGLLVIQISYTPLMLDQAEFGNICHEHVMYYTLEPLKVLLDKAGFELIDAQLNATNGGSLRVYATVKGSADYMACPLHWISIGAARIAGILEYEHSRNLRTPGPYLEFQHRIDSLKEQTVRWLVKQAEEKKLVVGYGASTKGNVLLQYYGITKDLLPYIAEASRQKWGLCTVGTGIPIISEVEMRAMRPDYLFVLPWFFIRYFIERESDLLSRGTRFVMPQPKLRIVP